MCQTIFNVVLVYKLRRVKAPGILFRPVRKSISIPNHFNVILYLDDRILNKQSLK